MQVFKYNWHSTFNIFSSCIAQLSFCLICGRVIFSTIFIEVLTHYLLQNQGTPPLKKFGTDADEQLRKSVMEKQRVCSLR